MPNLAKIERKNYYGQPANNLSISLAGILFKLHVKVQSHDRRTKSQIEQIPYKIKMIVPLRKSITNHQEKPDNQLIVKNFLPEFP